MQSGVDLTNVKMSMNPFCEIAVEVSTAVRASLPRTLAPVEVAPKAQLCPHHIDVAACVAATVPLLHATLGTLGLILKYMHPSWM